MGRIIITKKSPERNEVGSGQGQGIKKPWHIGQHPDRAAGFPEGITKRILAVPEPGQRLAADSRSTKLPGAGSVHGRGGRYRLAAIKITGKSSGSGRQAADFSGKQCWPQKTAAGNDRQGVQNGRA